MIFLQRKELDKQSSLKTSFNKKRFDHEGTWTEFFTHILNICVHFFGNLNKQKKDTRKRVSYREMMTHRNLNQMMTIVNKKDYNGILLHKRLNLA